MCLLLVATATSNDRETLELAARKAAAAGLRVELEHPVRWRWARDRPAKAVISEGHGCACSLLSDDADWNADAWAMRPELLERLGRTLEVLAEHGPDTLSIEALWVGETARETIRVTPAKLAALGRASRLGTRTRYVIDRGAG